MKTKDFAKIYFVILVAHLAFLGKNDAMLLILTSVLLPLALIAYFFSETGLKHSYEKWIFAGLIACVIGNFLFQQSSQSDYYFLLAVVVFFIAHVLYSIGFILENNGQKGIVQKFIVPGLLPLLAGFLLCWHLWPFMADFRIPVAIYSFGTSVLIAAALNRTVNTQSYVLVAAATFLFLISESVTGYSKFVKEIPFASLISAACYYVAQFCLLLGFVISKEQEIVEQKY